MKTIFSFLLWLSPGLLLDEVAYIQQQHSGKARVAMYFWLASMPITALAILYLLACMAVVAAKMVLA